MSKKRTVTAGDRVRMQIGLVHTIHVRSDLRDAAAKKRGTVKSVYGSGMVCDVLWDGDTKATQYFARDLAKAEPGQMP